MSRKPAGGRSGTRRGRGSRPARPASWHPGWIAASVVAVAAVLFLTLRPADLPSGVNLEPLEHHGRALRALVEGHPNWRLLARYLATDVLGNIVLFLPIGLTTAGAAGGWPPAGRMALAGGLGLALSVLIELGQLGIPGRSSDVDDVIFNTAGAVVGAAAHAVAVRWWKRRGRPGD